LPEYYNVSLPQNVGFIIETINDLMNLKLLKDKWKIVRGDLSTYVSERRATPEGNKSVNTILILIVGSVVLVLAAIIVAIKVSVKCKEMAVKLKNKVFWNPLIKVFITMFLP